MTKQSFESRIRAFFNNDETIDAVIQIAYDELLEDGIGFEGDGALSGTVDSDGNRLPSPHDALPSVQEMQQRRDNSKRSSG